MKIHSFKMYPVLFRLPLSDTQRNILSLALTFHKKGLQLSNPDIAEILNRHTNTVNKAIIYLRDNDLIKIEKPRSRYRAIYPGKGKIYLSFLRDTVSEFYLSLFANLLNPSEGCTLIPPEGITKGKKEYNKEFLKTFEGESDSGLQEPTGATEEEIQSLIEGGFLNG